MANKNKNNITPIWESPLLNVEEASDYFHIGVNKIRDLTNGDNNPYVLWIGTKRMIKREARTIPVGKLFGVKTVHFCPNYDILNMS